MDTEVAIPAQPAHAIEAGPGQPRHVPVVYDIPQHISGTVVTEQSLSPGESIYVKIEFFCNSHQRCDLALYIRVTGNETFFI